MDRRTFLKGSALSLLFYAAGCRPRGRALARKPKARAAVRRGRRRRRRYRRIHRRWHRRNGRRVHVHVVPIHIEVEDVVHLEEHGECEVAAVEEERIQVKTSSGTTVWVDILKEGEDEGEELPE